MTAQFMYVKCTLNNYPHSSHVGFHKNKCELKVSLCFKAKLKSTNVLKEFDL